MRYFRKLRLKMLFYGAQQRPRIFLLVGTLLVLHRNQCARSRRKMPTLFNVRLRGGFFAKSRLEVASFVFVLLVIHLIFWFYYCRLLPHIYGEKEWTETGYIGPCLLMLFSYLNIMLNIWMILINDTTSGSHFLPSIRRPSWIFCSTCVINSPPRSYHCEFCDR